jgi:hypothetical protein
MQILAALFLDDIDVKADPAGGPTRIDLGGVHFSTVAPGDGPFELAPHLVVIIHCRAGEDGNGVLEVRYLRDGEQIARNVQPFDVEPGKFTYRLVRGELEFDGPGSIEAHCRIGQGEATIVPYTVLAPR